MEAPGALVMVAALRLGTMRATPRSAILATMPTLRRTFLADRSRWMMGGEWLCRKDRPLAMSWRMERFRLTGMKALVGGGGSGSSISWRLVCNISMTSAGIREPGKKQTPRNCTTCMGCRLSQNYKSLATFISLAMFARYARSTLNPWLRSLNHRLRSLNPWLRSLNHRLRSLNPWLRSLNHRLRSLNPWLRSL